MRLPGKNKEEEEKKNATQPFCRPSTCDDDEAILRRSGGHILREWISDKRTFKA